MTNEEIVESCINIMKNRFEDNPNLFLTEEDIRGHLFVELLKYFNVLKESKDKKQTIELHLNISWLDNNENLYPKPDIAIVDVSTLDFREKTAKGFIVDKIPFCIELKLNKEGGSQQALLDKLHKDLDKLKDLKTLNSDTQFYEVCFDKKACLNERDIERLRIEYANTKIIYVTPKD